MATLPIPIYLLQFKPIVVKNSITPLVLLFTFLIYGTENAQVKMNFKFDTPYEDHLADGKSVELNETEIY